MADSSSFSFYARWICLNSWYNFFPPSGVKLVFKSKPLHRCRLIILGSKVFETQNTVRRVEVCPFDFDKLLPFLANVLAFLCLTPSLAVFPRSCATHSYMFLPQIFLSEVKRKQSTVTLCNRNLEVCHDRVLGTTSDPV